MDMFAKMTLPSGYEENTLFLLVQSPRVLYAYWELSPGQRAALAEKGRLQLRLNIAGAGLYRSYDIQDIKTSWNSFYFSGVLPDCEYYCEIGILDESGEFYPILHSNTVFTPPEKPGGTPGSPGGSSFWGTGAEFFNGEHLKNFSSGIFYKK